jgi:hypothetical protein
MWASFEGSILLINLYDHCLSRPFPIPLDCVAGSFVDRYSLDPFVNSHSLRVCPERDVLNGHRDGGRPIGDGRNRSRVSVEVALADIDDGQFPDST